GPRRRASRSGARSPSRGRAGSRSRPARARARAASPRPAWPARPRGRAGPAPGRSTGWRSGRSAQESGPRPAAPQPELYHWPVAEALFWLRELAAASPPPVAMGGKARHLALLCAAGLPVPDGFVLPGPALRAAGSAAGGDLWRAALAAAARLGGPL